MRTKRSKYILLSNPSISTRKIFYYLLVILFNFYYYIIDKIVIVKNKFIRNKGVKGFLHFFSTFFTFSVEKYYVKHNVE
ncbi:MAG: hypothetical protein DRJ45_07360 [Thermoprotei archaeon]|nr:MAG: hypothetical protein DRJ45_07360 [Thermoprotei archaeon]